MNPIMSIWTQPTKTLAYILENKKIGYGFLLIALYSISAGMVSSAGTGLFSGFPLGIIVLLGIVSTFIGSLIGWLIGAAMYTWVGKWLGGKGTFSDMARLFPAFSLLMIWLAPMHLAMVVMYGPELFDTPTSQFAITNLPIGVYLLTNVVTLAIGIYGVVIASKGIGLVHGFSAMRGFGVILIIIGIGVLLAIVLSFAFSAVIFSLISM